MRKFLLVGAGLGLILISWLVFKAITKDEVRPQLLQIYRDNAVLAELAESATNQAGEQSIKTTAANIWVVILSDNRTLSDTYNRLYGQRPGTPKSNSLLDELEALKGSAYDVKFTESAKLQLEKVATETAAVAGQTENTELKTLLSQLAANQQTLLGQL